MERKLILAAALLSLMSCDTSAAACAASKDRLITIYDKRMVLASLRDAKKLGKKKFKAIDDMLVEEQELAFMTYTKRCNLSK